MKRSRIEENKYDSIWARLVARMLFVILRLTELALSLMGERIYMGTMDDTDVEVTDMEDQGWEQIKPHGWNKAFSLWPRALRPGRSRTISEANRSISPVSQTPPTASEEKSPSSYRATSVTPSTPPELMTKAPLPKAFPQEIQKKTNKKEPEELEEIDMEKCKHTRTSKRGTNAFVTVEKCLQCGKTLKSERKSESEITSIKKEIESPSMEPGEDQQKDQTEFAEFLEYQKWKKEKEKQRTGGNKK